MAAVALLALTGTAACDDDGASADPAAFCAAANGVAADPVLLEPELTPEQLDRLVETYEELEDTTPEPVRSDVAFLADAARKLREGDVSFATDEEQAVRLALAFEAVSDYVREDCP